MSLLPVLVAYKLISPYLNLQRIAEVLALPASCLSISIFEILEYTAEIKFSGKF